MTKISFLESLNEHYLNKHKNDDLKLPFLKEISDYLDNNVGSIIEENIIDYSKRGFKEKAAAKYAGVSTSLLQKYRCTGNGGPKFIRIGRAVVYLREDLDAWLDEFQKSDNIAY